MEGWWAAHHSTRQRGASLCGPRPHRYFHGRPMFTVLVVVLLLDALILAVSVLLQAGQGGGLASLGGGAGTEMLMGGRPAATILHQITWRTAGIFLSSRWCSRS